MSKVTVIHVNGHWFLPVGDSVREIPYALVYAWQQDSEVKIMEVEHYV